MRKQLTFFIMAFAMAVATASCNKAPGPAKTAAAKERKIGVLLVNHGSRQKSWRDMLLDVEHHVDRQLLAMPNIKAVRTAFNEYTEPSVATRMKEFDDEGFDEVIVLPLFLTVGGHTVSDIPNLIGIKNDAAVLEGLPKTGVPVYRPRVKVTLLSTLDSTHFVKENILRRTRLLLKNDDGRKYGLTLAAYGDDKFNQQWEELMADIGKYLKEQVGIDTINYAWSGHLVNYSSDPTRKAVNQILAKKQKDIVISVYVAFDKQFQQDIIGGGIKASDRPQDVLYNDTEAILPDQDLNDWVVNSVKDTLSSRQLASRS